MIFAWSQVEGPAIPARFLAGTSSQLFIPSDVLLGGRNYVFALRVFNSGDPAQSVESTLDVDVRNSALRAVIAGGGSREVSTSKAVSRQHAPHPSPRSLETVPAPQVDAACMRTDAYVFFGSSSWMPALRLIPIMCRRRMTRPTRH